MKLTLVRSWWLLSLGIFPATWFSGPEAPKGSITSERIADISFHLFRMASNTGSRKV